MAGLVIVTTSQMLDEAISAYVDADDMYQMGKQKNDYSLNEPETWSSARRARGALTESYFASGCDVFVVEGGEMRTRGQWDELLAY